MKLRTLSIVATTLICVVLAGCSGIKYLPAGEKLYTGAAIHLESTDKAAVKNKRNILAAAKDAIRPKPNKTILGMRPKLLLYGLSGKEPKNKFRKWLGEKGEEPILLSSIKPEVTSGVIDARLFNYGMFSSFTEATVIEGRKTAKIVYTSKVNQPIIVSELTYDISDTLLRHHILGQKDKSLVKIGEDYNLNLLKGERIRIDAFLKDQGYFYFNPDYLLFKADTSSEKGAVQLKLTLKDSIPNNALIAYRIRNVIIDQDYSLEVNSEPGQQDTVNFDDVLFVRKGKVMNIRPEVILKSVFLIENETYSRKNHTMTLNRLMSLGNFKFIQIKFTESDSAVAGFLDTEILITPLPKRAFRAEIELVSKSNNYTGPRVNVSVLNRNAFRGAELLNINMAGSFEAQLTGKDKNLFSYAWNPQVELNFPMFLVPFPLKAIKSTYVPKTRILLSYNYLKRVGYFDLSTLQFIYGYRWKRDIRQEHEFNPVNISYTSIANESTIFTDLLAANPFLKKSYEEQFVAGGSYSYTFNEQVIPGKKVQFYIHATSEIAGNALSLVKMIAGETITSDIPSRIAGSVYSQFARISLDGRVHYNLENQNKIVLRLFAGFAVPYGNSSILPYVKQFFSGGPNSVRAFPINGLGPGSFYQTFENTGFLHLGGDVKLEANAEYRFRIFKFLHGALFADAGNVWLLKSNPSESGTPFSMSGFADELAVGAGVGLRLDVSFFVLRFDLAMPLRKPWLEQGSRWVTDQMNFGDPAWRRQNLILNVAIGYPF